MSVRSACRTIRPSLVGATAYQPWSAGTDRRDVMSFTHPQDLDRRPVLIIGAGTLGMRIALMFAAGGSDVRIVNRSPERAEVARRFVEQQVDEVRQRLGL